MQVQRVWVLRGPNIWARVPVLEVELELADLKDTRPHNVPAFNDRLLAWLPTLATLADFTDQCRRGAHLGQVLQHVTLELQRLAGSSVRFGITRVTSQAGYHRVVVEYEEEELAHACLATAQSLCQAAWRDEAFDPAARLAELRDLSHDVRFGPSTGAIVRAARLRNIPIRRLNRGSLVQLGYGRLQRRICTAETDRTGAIAETIAQDKQLTRSLLQAVGVPVPEGRPVVDAEDAWRAAEELRPPVVVKPQYGNHGRGVATNLTTREQVVAAYAAAQEEGASIIVETFIPGVDHRLLVIGDQLVAAALREPAQVVGDGRSTITQLVEEVNRDPRRSAGHGTVLSFIKLDPVGLAVLAEQGYTPESVPEAGVTVLIRRNGNLSTGGTATDVTDQVHPEVAARAVDAALTVGLDIAGVDVVALDISRPLEAQRGAIVEVNAGPGLRMHLEPSAGTPRLVGEAIVNLLFAEGQTGRIPIIAVTGVNGKTTTTRLIAHLLKQTGSVVGMTCTDGLFVDGRRIDTRDCSGPRSARAVLANPRVDVAVLETARGGILREGLGFDSCDVAVMTNIGGGDHLDLRGIETVADLARVKCTVVEAVAPSGTAVLNAADPLVAAMAPHCSGSVTYFARDGSHSVITAHRQAGGRAVFVREGVIVCANGSREEALLPVVDVPCTYQGGIAFQVENVLAAVAAAWALNTSFAHVCAGLGSFAGDVRQVPARFNVLQANGATVIVDYAHNPSALAAVVASLDHFPHRHRTLVFTGCNRRDVDVIGMGEIVGNGFDRVILYQDHGNNERADGDLNRLLRQGLAAGKRVAETVDVVGERAAIESGLAALAPGELLVVGVESIEESVAFIEARLATQKAV